MYEDFYLNPGLCALLAMKMSGRVNSQCELANSWQLAPSRVEEKPDLPLTQPTPSSEFSFVHVRGSPASMNLA